MASHRSSNCTVRFDVLNLLVSIALELIARQPISAMAAVTKNLNFAITESTSFEPPFLVAKRFSTLDHLTGCRFGWNIVTSWKKARSKQLELIVQLNTTSGMNKQMNTIEFCTNSGKGLGPMMRLSRTKREMSMHYLRRSDRLTIMESSFIWRRDMSWS